MSRLRGIVPVAMVAHLLQVFSPLRLHTDAIVYLLMASSAADGGGFIARGVPQKYPLGFPALVVSLEWLGLAKPPVFFLVNYAFFALGIFLLGRMDRKDVVLPASALFSFLVVKHLPFPATDILFFGLSVTAIYLLDRVSSSGPTWIQSAALFALLAAACFVRGIGIALFPPFFWVLSRRSDLARCTRPKAVRYGLWSLFFLGGVAVMQTTYFQESFRTYARNESLPVLLWGVLTTRVHELGEVFLNVPAERLAPWIGGGFYLGGLLGVGLLMLALVRRRAQWGAVEIYVVTYGAILFLWPCTDARFWIPVVPFLFLLLRSLPIPRPIRFGYALYFVATGLIALAYSLQLTFSGDRFIERFGDGTLRKAYQAAFGQGDPGDLDAANQEALYVLKRYGQP